MTNMMDMSCRDFVSALASAEPTPGGGGGVGMGGAMGMALCNMVANLTIGKKAYAEVEDEVKALLEKGMAIQEKLLALVDEDAAAFEPLSKAYGLPKTTEEERKHKMQVLSEEAKKACDVPMKGARLLIDGLKVANRLAQIGSKLVLSDVSCGAALMVAALKCARHNVMINLAVICDVDYIMDNQEEIVHLLSEGEMTYKVIESTSDRRMNS